MGDTQQSSKPDVSSVVSRRRKSRLIILMILLLVILLGSGAWVGVASRERPTAHPAVAISKNPTNDSGSMKAQWVIDENAKPGTDAWRLDPKKNNTHIEGYADKVSVQRGESVTLYVSTDATAFHVEAYRMGYYGGAQGRLIWQSPDEQGIKQSKDTVTAKTNMVEAHWKPSLSVAVDSTWPPGDYLFKLIDGNGNQHYVPLTVRDDSSNATYLIKNSVTTWQAYNLWGDYDLYLGVSGKGESFANRARSVSFDRPYKIGDGSGDYLGNEQPLVSLAESMGLDVTYTTDVDVNEHPDVLLKHKTLLSLGHDEYWSTAMRQGALSARDAGVNIAFFGANADFRHIRFQPSALGIDRQEIDYKSATEDPLNGVNNAEVTVDWRDPPTNKPESVLNGNYYECNPVRTNLVVQQPDSWLFSGTGVARGVKLGNLVGSEYDHYTPSAPAPLGITGMQIMAHSPVTCRGAKSFSDVTYYSAPNRGGVFDSGTSSWIPALSWACSDTTGDACTHDVVTAATKNLLSAFGEGPAGNSHPMVDNSHDVSESPARQASDVD